MSYTSSFRAFNLWKYNHLKNLSSKFLRFQYPHEPSRPKILNSFPGPAHLKAIEELQSPTSSDVDYYEKMQRFVNFKQSKGNYFKDTDGNTVLDMNAAQAGLILGYNSDDLVNVRTTEAYDRFITHKVDANSLPTSDFADLLREMVMPVAPKGMVQVHLGGGSTGAEANELALAVALKQYAKAHKIDVGKLCVMGFDNSNHGQTTGTLSCSSTDANPDKMPAFPWPKAEYPQLRYPLAHFEHENKAEEDRCISVIKKIISSKRSEGQAVGAMIIEPISSINNQMATPYFYKTLRNLAKVEGIPFVVDETKTGMGASGKNWAHEYWYLQDGKSPDFMTFGGKSGISGFYSTIDGRLNEEATSFQQNVDMVKLLNYGTIWKVIEGKDLLHLQKDTSSFLKIELERVGKETGFYSNVRGYGTHLGFDCQSPERADSIQRYLFKAGVHVLKCGPKTIGIRPSMELGVNDSAVFREALIHYHPNFE